MSFALLASGILGYAGTLGFFPIRVDLPQTPDFSTSIVTPKMSHVSGARPLVVILWDPKRPEHPAPAKEAVTRHIFGKEKSVDGWFRENSGGRFGLKNAGVLGWYSADKPAGHYWGAPDTNDEDKGGFVNGHTEKWTEAIRKADREFDFKRYDTNKNGVLEATELGVLFVIPQNGPFGTMRTPAGREAPKWEPLVVDGVRIDAITEAYAGKPLNLGLFAHELSHLLLGAPDMYMNVPYRAGRYSLMDSSYGTEHIDPFEKLKLGWLRWRAVSFRGSFNLRAIETTGDALILWDPKRGPSEYFLIENRWRDKTFDSGLPSDGVAVWHIVEDPAVFDKLEPRGGGPGEWGRNGIRLLRANGGKPVDDSKALFGMNAVCEAKWSDGAPAFRIKVASPLGKTVVVSVDRP